MHTGPGAQEFLRLPLTLFLASPKANSFRWSFQHLHHRHHPMLRQVLVLLVE
jgi:hypothetical protein